MDVDGSDASGNPQHVIIKFPNIFGSGESQIPPGATILTATLTLYNDDDPGDDPIIYILRENWTELEATWNNRTATSLWTDPGAYGSTSCDTSISASTTLGTANAYDDIDVTEFVQNWSNGAPNYGFLVYPGGTSGITISSKDDPDTNQRPLLTVTYEFTLAQWHANQTKPLTGTSNSTLFQLNLTDNQTYLWNCYTCDAGDLCNFSDSNYSFDINTSYVDNPPTVSLDSPTNGDTLTYVNVTFNCSATDDNGLVNITLYGNWSGGWHANQTKSLTGTSNSTTFQVNLTGGESYLWNCFACDNADQCNFALTNYTFTIDVIAPQINFTSPTPDNATSTTNTSIEINVSITEANLDEVIWNWNGTNFTIYNDSLVLAFNFDNRSELGECDDWGCKVYDISGYGNDGNLTNSSAPSNASIPTWVNQGKSGGAFKFETTDFKTNGDSILIPHNDSLNPGSRDFAIMFWIKWDYCLDCDVMRKGSKNTASTWYKVEVGGHGTADLLSLNFNTDGTDATIETTTDYSDNKWHFVVAQRRGNTAELWVDGVSKGTATVSGSINNTANLTIGSKDTQNLSLIHI